MDYQYPFSNFNNKETPFSSILEVDYLRFVSHYLSLTMNQSSKYGSIIDHICISNDLFPNYRSCAIVGVENEILNYLESCSDHYPVYVVFE